MLQRSYGDHETGARAPDVRPADVDLGHNQSIASQYIHQAALGSYDTSRSLCSNKLRHRRMGHNSSKVETNSGCGVEFIIFFLVKLAAHAQKKTKNLEPAFIEWLT